MAKALQAVFGAMPRSRIALETGTHSPWISRLLSELGHEVIVANAYRDAQKIKGEGDAQAAATYSEAFGRDPQFAQFYRSLDAYKASFSKKSDVMVLDPSSDFFKAMRGPGSGSAAPTKK